MTSKQKILTWLAAALVRALKTFAQTAAAMLPVEMTITEVSWGVLFGTAALAAVASLLTSLAGLPEVTMAETLSAIQNKSEEE